MERWVVVGAGGFVEGSLLPYLPGICGLVTHRPIVAKSLCEAYGISLFSDLAHARRRGCTAVYIASSNESHLSWIKWALATGMLVVCEKPIIFRRDDLVSLKGICNDIHPVDSDTRNVNIDPEKKRFFGAMIKRFHLPAFDTKVVVLRLYVDALSSPDYLDPARGGLLFIELIHYVDVALKLTGPCSISVTGNRVRGIIVFDRKCDACDCVRTVRLEYDFTSKNRVESLPFTPDAIRAIDTDFTSVTVPASQLLPLYETLFRIDDAQRGVGETFFFHD